MQQKQQHTTQGTVKHPPIARRLVVGLFLAAALSITVPLQAAPPAAQHAAAPSRAGSDVGARILQPLDVLWRELVRTLLRPGGRGETEPTEVRSGATPVASVHAADDGDVGAGLDPNGSK